MSYTLEDVRYLIPEVLTASQKEAVESYLNEGKIPPADPCLSCEPNLIRKYIARIQKAERQGTWPPEGRIDGPLNAENIEDLGTSILRLTDSPAQTDETTGTPQPKTRKPKAD